MKERPILFSAPMVRAILEGRKTQTRRVDKYMAEFPPISKPDLGLLSKSKHGEKLLTATWEATNGKFTASFCPKGRPGDLLYVRESGNIAIDKSAFMYADHGGCIAPDAPPGSENWCREWKSCPSIHMPRWASRIILEITGVCVERLQDISEADAKAEGCEPADCCNAYYHGYSKLWESINGPGSWDANPWVWVIEFKVVKP